MRGVIALAGLCAAMHAQTAERGLASWYGAPYDGQQAANGSPYRQEEFTAAHRTLLSGNLSFACAAPITAPAWWC